MKLTEGTTNHSAEPIESKKNKLIMTIAWVLVIGGGLIISSFILWDLAVALWFDRSQPIWLRAALGLFYTGFTLLFLIILRRRLLS